MQVVWIEAAFLEDEHPNKAEHDEHWARLKSAHGLLVPGGFGDRGIAGKMIAIDYAIKNSIPYFGICLGMQLAVLHIVRYALAISTPHLLSCTLIASMLIVCVCVCVRVCVCVCVRARGLHCSHVQQPCARYY
jgi:CTP synthase (UTP-ammonia lyase)